MHRTNLVPEPSSAPAGQTPGRPSAGPAGAHVHRALLGGLAVAVLLGLLPGAPARAQQPPEGQPTAAQPAPAQPPPGQPPPGSLVLPVNANELRQMPTGRRIRTVNIADPRIVRVVAGPNPNQVYVVGQAPGVTTVTLTDEDGRT